MTTSDINADGPSVSQKTTHHTHAGERCNKYSTTPSDAQVSRVYAPDWWSEPTNTETVRRTIVNPDVLVTVMETDVTWQHVVEGFFGESLDTRPTSIPCPNSPGFFYHLDIGEAGPMPCSDYRECATCRWIRADRFTRQIRWEEFAVVDWLEEPYTDERGQQRVEYTPVKELVRPFGWTIVPDGEKEWDSFKYRKNTVWGQRVGIKVPYLQFPTHTGWRVVFAPVRWLLNCKQYLLMDTLPGNDNALASFLATCLQLLPDDRRYSPSKKFGGPYTGYRGTNEDGWGRNLGTPVEQVVAAAEKYAKENGFDKDFANELSVDDAGKVSWNPDGKSGEAIWWGMVDQCGDYYEPNY